MPENNEVVFYVKDKKKVAEVLATPSRTLPAGAKLVLLHLLSYIHERFYSWPSQKTIANKLGMSDRHVRNHLKVLQELKVITKMNRGFKVQLKHGGKYSRSTAYDLSALIRRKTKEVSQQNGNEIPTDAEK